jgi:peptide/nickel transport system substrate-binding protein
MQRDIPVSRRGVLRATGGSIAASLAAGTAGGEMRTAPPDNDVLELTNGTVTTLDPIAGTTDADREVIDQLFDTLAYFPQGEPDPELLLAQEMSVSPDGTTYTFELRRGIEFHDGRELTAADVVYSFERLAGSNNSRQSYFLLDTMGVVHGTDSNGEYVPGSLGVDALDRRTVEIELSSPFHAVPEILAHSAFAIVPEGIVGDIAGYTGRVSYDQFARSPVGCGPFELDRWSQRSEIVVDRFDSYHWIDPAVEGVRWQIVEDDNARYTYTVINENAHVPYVPRSQYDEGKVSIEGRDSRGRLYGTYGPLENGRTVPYYQVEDILSYYFGFNQANTEEAPRKAFAYAMNQQQLVQEVFNRPGTVAAHLTPPGIYPDGKAAYLDHADDYPYGPDRTNIDQARRVMEDAGYSDNDPYELELTIYESNFFSETAALLRDQLASAHVDLEIQQAQFSTLLSRGRNGDLEAFSLGWVMTYPSPDNFLQLLNSPETDTSQSAPVSYVNWDPDQSGAARRAAEAWQQIQGNMRPVADQDARNDAYVAMEEANWEDVVLLPILHPVTEYMRYDTIDIPRRGGTGRLKYNTVEQQETTGGNTESEVETTSQTTSSRTEEASTASSQTTDSAGANDATATDGTAAGSSQTTAEEAAFGEDDSEESMPGFGVGSAITAIAATGAIRWLTDDD